MSLLGSLVVFAVIWFLSLWVMLTIGLRTQNDDNVRVPGTPSGAPNNLNFKKKLLWTTLWAIIFWGLIVIPLWWTGFSIYSIDPLGIS